VWEGDEEIRSWRDELGERKGIIHLVLLREGVGVVRLMCLGRRWDCGALLQLMEIFLSGYKVCIT
jgi:hypothetical protein